MSWIPVGTPEPSVAPTVAPAIAEGSLGGPRRTSWSSRAASLPAVLDLLTHGDRVLAVREPGDDQCVDVFDRSGALLHTIRGRGGPWCVDARGPMLLGMGLDRRPTAWSLAEPSAEPILWSTRFNGRLLRDLRMLDDVVLACGLDPRTLGGPPPSVLVTAIRIDDYGDVSQWQTLRGATIMGEAIAGSTTHVVVGVEPAGPILAADDHVHWADWSLAPRAELELEGSPLLVSARSDARSWMLALHGDEPELRLLSAGRCELALPVHASFLDAERLLVTHDDGAILVAPSRIQSFDAQGNFRWKFARNGAARALVDATGTTIFTHGPALIAADPTGTCREIWKAPDDAPQLGPLAILGDELIVAAGPDLFALADQNSTPSA